MTQYAKIRIFAFLILTIVATACAPQKIQKPVASVRPIETTSSKQPAVSVPVLEKAIHDKINAERKKHGLSLLAWNNDLNAIARGHSKDMGIRGYFSHNSPEGYGFDQRYKNGGFACGIRVGSVIYGGAENIFQNNLYHSITIINGVKHYNWDTLEQIAESTVQGWMNSPGHRKNILTPHWKSEGIGVFIASDGKVYITQNFC